jgi:hypothetical protein
MNTGYQIKFYVKLQLHVYVPQNSLCIIMKYSKYTQIPCKYILVNKLYYIYTGLINI